MKIKEVNVPLNSLTFLIPGFLVTRIMNEKSDSIIVSRDGNIKLMFEVEKEADLDNINVITTKMLTVSTLVVT